MVTNGKKSEVEREEIKDLLPGILFVAAKSRAQGSREQD